jgi:LysM repeat protein
MLQSSPSPAPGAPRSELILAFSVLNLLVAAALLAWVLGHRSAGVSSESATPQPTVVSFVASPTPVMAIPTEATSTAQPVLPTSTPVPPHLPTDTPVPPPPAPTRTLELLTPASAPPPALPSKTSEQPTLTAAALPFTGTPPPVPSPSQPLPTETPLLSAPPTPVPLPPTVRPTTVIIDVPYYVRRGDTLSGLAARFHTTVSAIMRRNGLGTTKIYVGQFLIIPDP